MATVYKILGQTGSSGNYGNGAATLTANTNTNLYTVPAGTQTIVSTITICNQANTNATFRIYIRPDGAAAATQNAIAYDTTVLANNTTALTLGMTIDASDIITVYASANTVSFTAFGSEIVA